ncbi:MAG: DUF87 domain-containing protein [Anaerolineales bacterium]|nr:DUF87 domain-containing protein [Anaerolineales bacterium]
MSTFHFYLGRHYDPALSETTRESLLYDPADLTTHAVVVGMTGSGKTGLCIGLLEEAALQGIPALMIDPKGDITNALLHFPNLASADFQPWINADLARRTGKTPEQAATEAADLWKKGLAQWDIPPERLQQLADSAHFTVYTPGSDAGIPVSILASLKAPQIPWAENRELLREKISGTATALLGLVGLEDIDPVRSREHILLANIFENAWSQNKDLDLGELILQVQTPPFQKLGVFDINTFFPPNDRFGLAMLLNNILAAPTFQAWIEGEPLDIPALLYTPDGLPRHTIFYLAHLTDSERMFFTTLLLAALETWMRAQPGTPALRALLYFDEIFGYLPPARNPPSKNLLLRLLKQARAFGLGLLLVTQNPVDLDYKALANAGTWFIGKLQTERDKDRLLDGLEGATSGNFNRATFNTLISQLGKRVFLLHNIHQPEPLLFQTRWTMNYLAGPLTRTQLPALNALAASSVEKPEPDPNLIPAAADVIAPPPPSTPPTPSLAGSGPQTSPPPLKNSQFPSPSPSLLISSSPLPGSELPGSQTRPPLPAKVTEYFIPHTLTLSQAAEKDGSPLPPDAQSRGLLYRPALLAQASVRLLNRKYNLDHALQKTVSVVEPDPRGLLHWEEFETPALDPRTLDRGPVPQSRFAPLEGKLAESAWYPAQQTDFLEWIYRHAEVTVRANEALKVYAGPNVSPAEFRTLCSNAARAGRDAELAKISQTHARKIEQLKLKLARETRELESDKSELSQRKMEEMGTHAENVFGFLTGSKRRNISTSLSKRRMTEKAKADVEESEAELESLEQQLASAEQEKATALEDLNQRWADLVTNFTEIPVQPFKKDIRVELFGLAWYPYWLVETGGQVIELPGFGS